MKRSFEDFRVLDKHLHLCIFDRRFSQLAELPRHETLKGPDEVGLNPHQAPCHWPETLLLLPSLAKGPLRATFFSL